MIRNLIFDMGNVLLLFDRDLFIERAGITDETEKELLMREVFLSPEWARMDWGALTDEEAADSICQRMPARLHEAVRDLVGFWKRTLIEIDGMYDLLAECKEKGYGIYLLSNASFCQHDYWDKIPCSRFFDGTMISCDVQLVKPQPEIYRKLLETFSLKAEECYFVDDFPLNVVGASVCGIQGAVFHGDAAELRRKMREAGIRVEA